jgi:thiol:disulfide interchange protein
MLSIRRHILLLGALLALGFTQGNLNPATWSAKVEPGEIKSGSKGTLKLTINLDEGWHVYSLTQPPPPRALKIKLEDNDIFTQAGDAVQPKPKVKFDPNFQIDTETFEGSATFTVPFAVAKTAAPGPLKVAAKVTFQVCDSERCLRPKTITIESDVKVAAAGAAGVAVTGRPQVSPTPTASPLKREATPTPSVAGVAATPEAVSSPSPSPSSTPQVDAGAGSQISANPQVPSARDLRSRGLLSYIWFALGFGFIALLTPCVFPMIPITVSFFTKRENESPRAAVGQALIYCFGIIFTFTGLGLLLTLIAGPAGINRVAASPWMNLFLTALFVVFALNLFGMFEIRLPSSWLSKLDSRAQGQSSLVATLLMGLTFTLTSFTCTAAFVGTVLVAATQGEWFWAAIGMFAFATAFASPFFLLALFPRWLHSLPKSGGWLNSVKVVMGFLEIAAAFKFLSNVDLVWGWQTVSRTMVLAAWVALAIITAIYLLGKFQLPYDTKVERLGVARMLSATFFLAMAFYLLTGLFGGKLGELDAFLPPDSATPSVGFASSGGNVAGPTGKWIESYEKGLEQARLTKRPIFVNFTGVTCTNCRWMELNMFPLPPVKKELDRFVLVELFTDRETPEDERNGQLQESRFMTVALPLYVILDPEGNELGQFPGLTRNRDEFVAFLQAGASRFNQVASR